MYLFKLVQSALVFIGFINHNNPNIHNDNIHNTLSLAASSYCPPSEILSWSCKTCSNDVRNINLIDDDTRIIMGYDKTMDSYFISIRGSSDINNWISNLETRIIHPYYDKDIGVHNGLYYEYLRYKDKMISFVTKLNHSVNLIITGHSSGGALASFLAYDLVTQGIFLYSNIHLYTFGSPRIGNKAFMKSFISFDIPHNRITYKNDIVPHLPQEFFGFIHLPHEIWFSSTNVSKFCHDLDGKEDDSCSNSCSPFSCTSVDDHLNYLDSAIGSNAC